MSWLRRLRGDDAPEAESEHQGRAEPTPAPVARTAPGIKALFDGLSEDGSHTILDLGPAGESNLAYYSRFAQRIRFAGVLEAAPEPSWNAVLDAIPRYADHPYDVVLGWDLLDRMPKEERPRAVERLAELTVSGARLYMLVDMSGEPMVHSLRFTLVDDARVSQEPSGPRRPAWPALLPAQVERVLEPFRVEHAFTLRQGMREYMAVRR